MFCLFFVHLLCGMGHGWGSCLCCCVTVLFPVWFEKLLTKPKPTKHYGGPLTHLILLIYNCLMSSLKLSLYENNFHNFHRSKLYTLIIVIKTSFRHRHSLCVCLIDWHTQGNITVLLVHYSPFCCTHWAVTAALLTRPTGEIVWKILIWGLFRQQKLLEGIVAMKAATDMPCLELLQWFARESV